MSFKHGDSETVVDDRLFNNYTPQSLGRLIAEFPQLAICLMWSTSDLRPGLDGQNWVNVIVRERVGGM